MSYPPQVEGLVNRIIIAITVSLRLYARSICSIVPLCIESNALEKSTINCAASRFFGTYSFDDSMDSQNVRSCGSISPKTVLIFLKNFLNLIGSKSYDSVVLSDSEVTSFKEARMPPLVHFSCVFCLYTMLHNKKIVIKFLCLSYFRGYFVKCCGPVKCPEERHKHGIMWKKYIEWKYKYSIGKRVLNVSLTAKVLGWS